MRERLSRKGDNPRPVNRWMWVRRWPIPSGSRQGWGVSKGETGGWTPEGSWWGNGMLCGETLRQEQTERKNAEDRVKANWWVIVTSVVRFKDNQLQATGVKDGMATSNL